MPRNVFFSLFTLIGTILGAGIFGVPYAVFHAGLLPSLFSFIFLGFVVTLLHLMFGEIILRNSGNHRLIYYSQKYLGEPGKLAIIFSTFVGVTGTLLVYIILGGDFLHLALFHQVAPFILSIFFWALLSFFVLRGFRFVVHLEALLDILFLSIIVCLFIFLLPRANFRVIPLADFEHFPLAYGVILFTLIGWVAIPEARRLLRNENEIKYFRGIIIFAGVITTLISALFGFVFAAVLGLQVSPDTLQGLSSVLNWRIISIIALLGALLVSSSFLIIAFYFIDSLNLDLKINRRIAKYFVLFLPLILFLLGLRNFIAIISFLGIVLSIIEGIIIVLCYSRAKKRQERKPEYQLNLSKYFLGFLLLSLILGATCYLFPK